MKIHLNDQKKVYIYYCGYDLKIGGVIPSPLPKSVRGGRDNNPSFSIYFSENGDLIWKDHGRGGKMMMGDCLSLIQLIEGLKEFKEVLDFFQNRILKANMSKVQEVLEDRLIKKKGVEPLPIINKGYSDFELKYYSRFGFSEEDLRKNYIFSSGGIDWERDGNIDEYWKSCEETPKFIYDLSNNRDLSVWKLYNPLTKLKRDKWRSKNLGRIPSENYYNLPPQGKELIICSSKKDGMCLQKIGILSDNPCSETSYSSFMRVVDQYNKRFEDISILFDGDLGGKTGATNLSSKTGWRIREFNYPPGTKDLAEIVELYDYNTLKNLI